jgi:hypothetical protein
MARQNQQQTPGFDIRPDVLANGIERRRIESIVTLKRMLAGSIVILMLAVSSMAAACDLSCGFAEAQADCHSMRMKAGDSSVADMRTSDTEMGGMAMPPESSATLPDRVAISPALRTEMRHARIGEMGPCERQSCNEFAAYILKSACQDGSQSRIDPAIASLPLAAQLQTTFHDAGDGITTYSPGDRGPLLVALRI